MEEEINYNEMRYILDDEGYILEVNWGCSTGECTEYTGTIPTGYESLEDWFNNANIRAYKIVDGNLVLDASKEAELQREWEQQVEDNKPVLHSELYGMQQQLEDLQSVNNSQYAKKTATGEFVNINDAKKCEPSIKLTSETKFKTNELVLQVDGKSEQDGTPTPDTPVEIKSVDGIRNLLNNQNYSLGSIGSTGADETSTITYRFNDYIPIKSNTIIYLLKELCIYYYDENKAFISLDVNGGLIKTTPTNAKYIRFRTFAKDFDTFNNEDYMVSYEPIKTYVPYGNWLIVQTTGKNLCKLMGYKLITNLNGTIINNNYAMNVIVNTTNTNSLYVSGDFSLLESGALRIGLYNEYPSLNVTGTRITKYDNGVIDTTNCNYVLFTFLVNTNSTFEDIENSFQIEQGSTATDYEPYKENITLIDMNIYDEEGNITGHHELCSKGDIKDTLIVNPDGTATIEKKIGKIVLNGNENWYKNSSATTTSGYHEFSLSMSDKIKENVGIISDRFAYSASYSSTKEYIRDRNNDTNLYINILRSRLSSTNVTGFKAWLSNNPVTVKYVLAEPYTIDLGKYNIQTFEDVNNISLLSTLDTDFTYDFVNNNFIQLITTNKNMLPNEATTQTINGIAFTQNVDRSITLDGTSTEVIEYNIAGSSSNTSPFLCFKKNIDYYLSGLSNITMEMYHYDGIDKTQIYSGTGGHIKFTDEDKQVTQIILSIPTGTTFNEVTIYPQLEYGDGSSQYEKPIINKLVFNYSEYIEENEIDSFIIEDNSIKAIIDGEEYELEKCYVGLRDGINNIYTMQDTNLDVTYCIDKLDIDSLEFLQGKATTTNKFKILEDGSIEANNGTFKGGTLRLNDDGTQNGASIKIEVTENGKTRETTYSGYGIESDIVTNYDYTQEDVQRALNIYNGEITPTQEDYDRLDINKDGEIDIFDASDIQLVVLMRISKDSPGHFSIDTHASFNDNIVITNGLKEKVVSIGLNGVESIGGNLYYKDGDTYELASFIGGGYVTGSGKCFNLGTLFTPKSLANISSVSLNEGGKLTVRQGGKYVVGSATAGARMMLNYCYAQKMGDNAIGIFYNAPSAHSAVINDDAIGVIMSNLSITLHGYEEEE